MDCGIAIRITCPWGEISYIYTTLVSEEFHCVCKPHWNSQWNYRTGMKSKVEPPRNDRFTMRKLRNESYSYQWEENQYDFQNDVISNITRIPKKFNVIHRVIVYYHHNEAKLETFILHTYGFCVDYVGKCKLICWWGPRPIFFLYRQSFSASWSSARQTLRNEMLQIVKTKSILDAMQHKS